MNKIEGFREQLESPSLNGITFPDGTIKIFDIKVEWSPTIIYTIKEKEDSSIDILKSIGQLHWSDCAVITKLIDKERSIEVIAGEGDYGDDGFVGVIDLNSRKLIWLAFFNCSNPFDKLKIIDDYLYARSTSGCFWKFKIEDPTIFEVTCL